MASLPRWAVLKKTINSDVSITSQLRMRLGTLGEIIPVLFHEMNYFRIICRVGECLYYCKSRDESCGYESDPEFGGTDYADVLEIISVTYTQLLALSGAAIGNLLSDHLMRHNLDSIESTITDSLSLRQIAIFDKMRNSAAGQDRGHSLEAWSEEDLVAVRDFTQRDVLKPW